MTTTFRSQESLEWKVRVGDHTASSAREDGVEDHNVTLLVVHPSFNSSHHGNDIALVRLATPPIDEKATPVCLPAANRDAVGDGIGCYVTGWGETRGGSIERSTSILLSSPSLISLMVSVDVKHDVNLLT